MSLGAAGGIILFKQKNAEKWYFPSEMDFQM